MHEIRLEASAEVVRQAIQIGASVLAAPGEVPRELPILFLIREIGREHREAADYSVEIGMTR